MTTLIHLNKIILDLLDNGKTMEDIRLASGLKIRKFNRVIAGKEVDEVAVKNIETFNNETNKTT